MAKLKWNRHEKREGFLLFSTLDNKIHIYYLVNRDKGSAQARYHLWDEEKLESIGHFDTIKECKNVAEIQ